MKAFGRDFDLEVRRTRQKVTVALQISGKTLVFAPDTEIVLP